MGCGPSQPSTPAVTRSKVPLKKRFQPRISNDERGIALHYDVVVIGSGHAGSVAACRAARSGRSVCVMERGKEWTPGQFPDKIEQVKKEVQVRYKGKLTRGSGNELYDFNINDDVTIASGCALGGSSVISANVLVEPAEKILQSQSWPSGFREDLTNFREDIARVKDVLEPSPYPYMPAKACRMEELAERISNVNTNPITDIEDIAFMFDNIQKKTKDKVFYKVDLGISYEQQTNKFGVVMDACTGCGNCISGCNVGAKNTVNVTYLADAKYHGAEIFTEVVVEYLNRSPINGRWEVNYTKRSDDVSDSFIISAENVILCAGSLGSTELLLRSKSKGLDTSDQIGKGFCGNGDRIAFSYANDRPSNSFGTPYKRLIPIKELRPGPTTVCALDFCEDSTANSARHHDAILYDSAVPLFATELFRLILLLTPTIKTDEWKVISNKLQERDLDHCLITQALSHDDHIGMDGKRSTGQIQLSHDSVKIDWSLPEPEIVIDAEKADVKLSTLGDKINYTVVDKIQKLVSELMGGKYVPNPSLNENLEPSFGSIVTSQPLGGCCMGECGMDGVVNHKGQVFKGNTKEVHTGLYVMDGSIIPHSLGTYPALTISAIAERSMRLMAHDLHWELPTYSFNEDPENIKLNDQGSVMALKAREFLEGYIRIKNEWAACKAKLTFLTEDVHRTLFRDPTHRMEVDGSLLCPDLEPEPMVVSGTVELIAPETKFDEEETKNMWYKLMLQAENGKNYYLLGHKALRRVDDSDVGWIDANTVFVRFYRVENNKRGTKIGEGELALNSARMMQSMRTIEVTNTVNGAADQLQFKVEFAKFLLRDTWDVLSPFSRPNSFYPKAPPRWKRPLRIPEAACPVVHYYVTQDGLVLQLLRFYGGPKGPVILSHGIGVSSAIYSLDTVKTNLVEYLVGKKYDVWCMDWRGSIRLPYACEQFTFDDVAAYDYPAAIDRVLEITDQSSVQIVVHCAGAEAFFASMLSGQLEGKVRSVVTSETSFILAPSAMNKLKAGVYSPEIAMALGLTEISTMNETSWFDDMLRKVSEALAESPYPWQEECRSHVCHRITFIYGLLWNHDNLNDDTHFSLHELFGVVNGQALAHLSRSAREGKLVDAKGQDIYLPRLSDGLDGNEELRQCLDYLKIPICFLNGSKNQCYDPEGMERAYQFLKSANPEQDYRRVQVENYGHLDVLVGKDACKDVYPHIVDFLDVYANECPSAATACYYQIHKELLSQEGDQSKWSRIETPRMPSSSMLQNHIQHPDFEDDAEETDIVLDEIDEDDEFLEESSLQPVDGNLSLKTSEAVVFTQKSVKESQRQYVSPESEQEDVVIEKVTLKREETKRCIYVVGGLYFGSKRETLTESRIRDFMVHLFECADEIHTLVLNGDILDMWCDPAGKTPRTQEEYLHVWKSGSIPGLSYFCEGIKKLSFELDVNVFYVRGDHDHQLTPAMVASLFGSNIKFISGTLIYKIEQENEIYYIRFEHGHDWDPFSSYVLKQAPDGLIDGETLGYYFTRTLPLGSYGNQSNVEVARICDELMQTIHPNYMGSFSIDVLSCKTLQAALSMKMLEAITAQPFEEDRKIIVDSDDGAFVTLGSLLKYRIIKRLIDQIGGNRTFDMFKYICGDATPLIGICDEDVIILSHTQERVCRLSTGKHGEIIYANTGSTFQETDKGLQYAYLRMDFPGRQNCPHQGSVRIVREGTREDPAPEIDSLASCDISNEIHDSEA